jgi:hypothetical protein
MTRPRHAGNEGGSVDSCKGARDSVNEYFWSQLIKELGIMTIRFAM